MCEKAAEHFIGIDPYALGYCDDHWLLLTEAIRLELRRTDYPNTWLLETVSHRAAEVLADAIENEVRARQELAYVEYRKWLDDAIERGGEGAGWIYFIQAVNGGPIKIGVTQNIHKRLDSLQTASPYQLRVLALIRGGQRLEQEYHRHFHMYRLSGEWFEPAQPILAEVERINVRSELVPQESGTTALF